MGYFTITSGGRREHVVYVLCYLRDISIDPLQLLLQSVGSGMEIEEVIPLVLGFFLNFMIFMFLGSWHFGISAL